MTLDQPVASLLPDSVPLPGATRGTITLRHLATHTSGLPRSPEIPRMALRLGLAQLIGYDAYADYTERDFLAALTTTILQSEPGARSSYSNYGAGLLAYALSHDRGSYQDALRAEILEPLGMNATTVSVDEAHEARMARGYASSLRLGPIMFARPAGPLANNSPLVGAGSVRSTATDMLKYLKANMGMTSGPRQDAITRSHRQLFRSAESGSIGMLWIVPRDSGIIWHDGLAPGFGAYMGFTTTVGLVSSCSPERATSWTALESRCCNRCIAACRVPIPRARRQRRGRRSTRNATLSGVVRCYGCADATPCRGNLPASASDLSGRVLDRPSHDCCS